MKVESGPGEVAGDLSAVQAELRRIQRQLAGANDKIAAIKRRGGDVRAHSIEATRLRARMEELVRLAIPD